MPIHLPGSRPLPQSCISVMLVQRRASARHAHNPHIYRLVVEITTNNAKLNLNGSIEPHPGSG